MGPNGSMFKRRVLGDDAKKGDECAAKVARAIFALRSGVLGKVEEYIFFFKS